MSVQGTWSFSVYVTQQLALTLEITQDNVNIIYGDDFIRQRSESALIQVMISELSGTKLLYEAYRAYCSPITSFFEI